MVLNKPLDYFLLFAIIGYLLLLPVYTTDLTNNGRNYAFSKEGKLLLSTTYVHAVFDLKLKPLRDQVRHTKAMFLKIKAKWQENPHDPKMKTLYMLCKEEYELLEEKFYEIERWLTLGGAQQPHRQKRFLGILFSAIPSQIVAVLQYVTYLCRSTVSCCGW